jgi:hypothetical protein
MNMGFTKYVVNFLTSWLALSLSKHAMLHMPVDSEIFRTCPDRPLGSAQLPVKWVPGLYRRSSGRGAALTTHPFLERRLKKEYSYYLLPLWDFVAYSKVNFIFFTLLHRREP